jgi:phage baseplate assembly protein W
MAYIVRNVDVLDLKPSTGVGISLPFNGPTGVNTTYTSKDAIKSNLLNFILTGKKERVMNPSFGSGVRDLLFEPITENLTDQIEGLIYGGVETYFPQVQINSLTVDLSPDTRTVTIYLGYSVINTNIEDELQINLNNGGV